MAYKWGFKKNNSLVAKVGKPTFFPALRSSNSRPRQLVGKKTTKQRIFVVFFFHIKNQRCVCVYIYIYIPGTQMTLVLVGKGRCFGGLTFKNRGSWGSRYTYIYICILYTYVHVYLWINTVSHCGTNVACVCVCVYRFLYLTYSVFRFIYLKICVSDRDKKKRSGRMWMSR